MPVYIGDYLADTMHLTTEQHGAYLLLLFHLWRRGSLPNDDRSLARIAGLDEQAWSNARAVLGDFFEIDGARWRHKRVERERERIGLLQEANSRRARSAALGRWQKRQDASPKPEQVRDGAVQQDIAGIAIEATEAMLQASNSQSETESQADTRSEEGLPIQKLEVTRKSKTAVKQSDLRHAQFRKLLGEYWAYKNSSTPDMPWEARDGKALQSFLAACPRMDEEQFRRLLRNRARSAVAHGDRVYLWIGNLTRFQEEIGIYNRPVSAGGANASKAEINRGSVFQAVASALELARSVDDPAGRRCGGVGQAGHEPAAFLDSGMLAADGARSSGFALASAEGGDHALEERDSSDGQA